MIDTLQISSVSKNNFISLMKSYERNYNFLYKLINFDIFCLKNVNKNFESRAYNGNKKILLSILSVTNHTALIKFSYNFFSDNTYTSYVDLKIYFDSKQVEILNNKGLKINMDNKNIQKFHNIRLSKWYKSYFLSLWLNNCIENGYSFEGHSEV